VPHKQGIIRCAGGGTTTAYVLLICRGEHTTLKT
jgi:hypothetical protein